MHHMKAPLDVTTFLFSRRLWSLSCGLPPLQQQAALLALPPFHCREPVNKKNYSAYKYKSKVQFNLRQLSNKTNSHKKLPSSTTIQGCGSGSGRIRTFFAGSGSGSFPPDPATDLGSGSFPSYIKLYNTIICKLSFFKFSNFQIS